MFKSSGSTFFYNEFIERYPIRLGRLVYLGPSAFLMTAIGSDLFVDCFKEVAVDLGQPFMPIRFAVYSSSGNGFLGGVVVIALITRDYSLLFWRMVLVRFSRFD